MYFPLAWHFCSKSSQSKIEKSKYRSLKLIANDYNSDYKFLLNETGNSTMEIRRPHTLALIQLQISRKIYLISFRIVLKECMILLYTVEIH